jgi:hypothetical protein
MTRKNIKLVLLTILLVLATSCTTSINQSDSEETATPSASEEELDNLIEEVVENKTPPILSTDLIGGCDTEKRNNQRPKVGEQAIEFTLMDIKGKSYTLSEMLMEKPVILIFGSYT